MFTNQKEHFCKDCHHLRKNGGFILQYCEELNINVYVNSVACARYDDTEIF